MIGSVGGSDEGGLVMQLREAVMALCCVLPQLPPHAHFALKKQNKSREKIIMVSCFKKGLRYSQAFTGVSDFCGKFFHFV